MTDGELDELARGLSPHHLPAELLTVYGWHDGWQLLAGNERVDLVPDADFLPLANAIASYRAWLAALGTDGWHPLWFPAFGEQSGELVVLQPEPGLSAGELFSFHAETELEASYDSVAALFSAALACWRARLLPPRDPLFLTAELRRLVARHNPRSQTPEGRPRRTISRFATGNWPDAWREAIGIVRVDPAPEELVVTIAELLEDPACGRPIRADVRGRGGTFDSFVVTASDAGHEVEVLATRAETENFRELAGGRRYELWLVPAGDGYLVKRVVQLDP